MRSIFYAFTMSLFILPSAFAELPPEIFDVPDTGSPDEQEVWTVDVSQVAEEPDFAEQPERVEESATVEQPTVVEESPESAEPVGAESSLPRVEPEPRQDDTGTRLNRESDLITTDTLPAPTDTSDGGCTYGGRPAISKAWLLLFIFSIGLRTRYTAITR